MKIKDLVEILNKLDPEMALIFETFDSGADQYGQAEIDEIALKVRTKILIIRL